jgi:hypothetical protein
MSLVNCPYLDLITYAIIEAYRRVEDRNLFCITQSVDPEISQLYKAMTEHRKNCFLCLQAARSAEREYIGSGRVAPARALDTVDAVDCSNDHQGQHRSIA